MTSIKEEQTGDGSMEDTRSQTISGTVDVANKADDANDIETLRAITASLVQHNVHVQHERYDIIGQLWRANHEITRLNNIIYARDATIVAANRSLAGKQKQLDSLYTTLQRQETQITTLHQQHTAKLARIRLRMNMMAKKTAKKFEKQAAENAAQTKLWAEDVKSMIAEDIESERDTDVDEETESNGEGGDEEMEVIEINDDEVAGTEQSKINGQSAVAQQSGKQRATAEQSAVTEQPAADKQQPNKRVKLTKGA